MVVDGSASGGASAPTVAVQAGKRAGPRRATVAAKAAVGGIIEESRSKNTQFALVVDGAAERRTASATAAAVTGAYGATAAIAAVAAIASYYPVGLKGTSQNLGEPEVVDCTTRRRRYRAPAAAVAGGAINGARRRAGSVKSMGGKGNVVRKDATGSQQHAIRANIHCSAVGA